MLFTGLIKLVTGLSLLASPAADPLTSAVADFRKVNAVYARDFSVSMDYYYYQDHQTSNATETTNGYYLKVGQNSYSKLHNVETVRNSKYTIVADNNAGNLVLLDPYQANKQEVTLGLDTLLRNCEKIEMSEAGGKRVYTLYLGDHLSEEFSRIKVYINVADNTLSRIVLYYKNAVYSQSDSDEERGRAKPPRVEIVYKNFSAKPAGGADLFNENRYVSVSGKKVKGIGKYAAYTVYNQKLN